MSIFGKYADYYDFFYKKKQYGSECAFVRNLFLRYAKRPVEDVLDLGCGTGGHALALANLGFRVTGLDLSERMLSLAKIKALKANLTVSWVRGQLQNFKIPQRFDAVICMFSVIDYLTKDEDLNRMLKDVHAHLRPGGVFICDFWHAPAVASFVPYKKRIFTNKGQTILRESYTQLLESRRL